MSSGEPRGLDDIKVDLDSLYREETFTDLKVATLRRLTPVLPDGSVDPGRKPQFMGQTSMMTQAGMVPIQCTIEADTLAEALEKFPGAIKQAIEEMIEEVKELQRQQASRIVVPKGAPPNLGGGPGGPGKIQFP